MTASTRSQARGQPLVRPRTGLHWALLGAAGGLGYAVLGLLASEPLGWWPAAPLSLVPLFAAALAGSRAPRRAAWRLAAGAWVGSLPLWVMTHAWISSVSPVGFIPGMLLQGAWAGVFVLLAALALRGRHATLGIALILALVWSFVEVCRGSVLFGGYAWLLVGHPLIDAPWIGRAGAVVGAYGVGFFVALSMGALVGLRGAPLGRGGGPLRRRAEPLAFVVAPFLLLAVLGALAPAPAQGPGARVAIIQTNVPQDNRIAWSIEDQIASFEDFQAITRMAPSEVDLIVWPETMLPGPPISPQAVAEMRRFGLVFRVDMPDRDRIAATFFHDELARLQSELGVPMIVGATGVDGFRLAVASDGTVQQEQDGFYNSAFLFVGGQMTEPRYDKLRLTIFGEVLPLVSRWDWLEEKLLLIGAGGMRFDLDAGQQPTWFDVPLSESESLRVATPICFEVAYPGVCRRLARGGGQRVDALVNLTNDGWFGSSDAGRAMHLKLARWRALENGVPVIRAANTGISTIIDARGRIASTATEHPGGQGPHAVSTAGQTFATRTPAIISGEVPPRTVGPTPYARLGGLAPWLLGLGGLLVLIRAVVLRPRPASA